MKNITQVLNEIQRERSHYNDNGADVFVVVDDHTTDDEPQVHRSKLTNELAARSTSENIAEAIVNEQVMKAIHSWRKRNE